MHLSRCCRDKKVRSLPAAAVARRDLAVVQIQVWATALFSREGPALTVREGLPLARFLRYRGPLYVVFLLPGPGSAYLLEIWSDFSGCNYNNMIYITLCTGIFFAARLDSGTAEL